LTRKDEIEKKRKTAQNLKNEVFVKKEEYDKKRKTMGDLQQHIPNQVNEFLSS